MAAFFVVVEVLPIPQTLKKSSFSSWFPKFFVSLRRYFVFRKDEREKRYKIARRRGISR